MTLVSISRKIVFNIPSLLPDGPATPVVRSSDTEPVDRPRDEACELVLEGDGNVAMMGYAVPDETSPSGIALRLSWRPLPGHGATVRGACSADFKRSVEEMYLSVSHGVELAVPAAGAEKRKERLENYAWTAEVAAR
jgi:hypothetical protein